MDMPSSARREARPRPLRPGSPTEQATVLIGSGKEMREGGAGPVPDRSPMAGTPKKDDSWALEPYVDRDGIP
jgi:hypothetical protein